MRRRGPRWTPANRTPTGRGETTPSPAATWPRRLPRQEPTWCRCPPTTSLTAPRPSRTPSGTSPTRARSTARSKLAGELEVRSVEPRATVVRTSWVCGPHGANMVKTVLRLAAEGGPLRFVNDQRGCPTFTGDLAGMLLRLGVARRSGLFHVTNQGPTTWFDFARDVVAAAGLRSGHGGTHRHLGVAAAASGAATSQLRARQHGAAPRRDPIVTRPPRAAGADGQGIGGLSAQSSVLTLSIRRAPPGPGSMTPMAPTDATARPGAGHRRRDRRRVRRPDHGGVPRPPRSSGDRRRRRRRQGRAARAAASRPFSRKACRT